MGAGRSGYRAYTEVSGSEMSDERYRMSFTTGGLYHPESVKLDAKED